MFAITVSSWAATFYVDATGGSDTNDGLSAATAWKTVAKVNGSTFTQGDQILFKRGQVWNESLAPPSSGASGNPIVFDAYGTGEAPTLTGYVGLPSASWALDSGNVWKTSITSSSFNYVLFGWIGSDGSVGSVWGTKFTSGKSALVAPYQFYFSANVLYVYSVGNPATYYGSMAAMLMTNGQIVYINGKNWLTIQHFKLTYFDTYGVRIGGASDHITIANVYSDGMIPAGTTPHGFYVSASPAPTDIKFYNVDAHRNYNGLRFDGSASGIVVKNCRAYGNRNHGLEDNTTGGGVNYSFCHFYGNGLAVVISTDTAGGVDGGGNLAAYTAPQTVGFQKYPARISLTVDDPGLISGADAYIDGILPLFDARGIQLSVAIVTGYDLSNQLISKFQSWVNAGRDVVSHSWSHQYFTFPNAFTLHYTGTGTAATATISGNHLTTTITGGPGGENLNLDLANASYDTMSELVATINSHSGYTVVQDTNCKGSAHTIGLADVSAQDIKGVTYTVLMQESRLMPDEITTSKAWMTANLTGLPSSRAYVYPGGVEDTSTQGYAAAAGYAGARGAFTMDLGTKDVYARGVNVQNITSFGANPNLQGLTSAQLEARIAALTWKSSVWGAPYGVFWHLNELNSTEVGNLLDDLVAHGATLMTNTQLINWVAQQSQTGTSTYYWASATGAEADMRPTKSSPVVNVGTDLGAGFALDLEGVDQRVFGAGWEMGAYALMGQPAFVVVVE
jgi:peptidoglycan/xylan/chitin deacetylase (PgdA/CDA1 family)